MRLKLNGLDYTVPVGKRCFTDFSTRDAERIFAKGLATHYRQKAKLLVDKKGLHGEALREALDAWTPPDDSAARERLRRDRLREAAKGFSTDTLLEVLGLNAKSLGPAPSPLPERPTAPSRPAPARTGGIQLPPARELDSDRDTVRPSS